MGKVNKKNKIQLYLCFVNKFKQLQMSKIKADLHTHSIVSGHAYSSIQEMVAVAAEKNIELLGITEHGPAIPGTCNEIYFMNIHVIPRVIQGVRLMIGCEINILDNDGTLDLSPEIMNKLDLRIAGIHDRCWQPESKERNTAGMIKVMQNPWIQIISHPGDGTAELDLEALVQTSKQTGTILEINNHSLSPNRKKLTLALPNNLELLRLCKKYNVPVLLGSDAHISFQVADYDRLTPLLQETEFPDELILNYDTDKLLQHLKPKPSL